MKYTANAIRKWDVFRQRGDNFIASRPLTKDWIPARPIQWGGLYGLWLRIKYAWGVVTGRYDVLDWEDSSNG